ncbi:MAG: S8 family serine peptidase [Eubacteriales bacterium]|nr:S8 family serine peptidase [Eubacteriales bacterium]
MRKIKYILSAVIIMLLCFVTAMAYEATSFDDYAQSVANMVNGSKSDISLMSFGEPGEFSCKRLIVRYEGKAFIPQGIRHKESVLYDDIGVFAFSSEYDTQKAYEEMRNIPGIICVAPDKIITLDTGVGVTQIDLTNYEEAKAKMESSNWGILGSNAPAYRNYVVQKGGKEVVVAVIDTGLKTDHPYFANSPRIIQGYNVTAPGSAVNDFNRQSHGTHVAGIVSIATSDNVKIKPYQIFDYNDSSSNLYFINAIEKAIQDNVDVINISLSMTSCNSGLLHPTLDKAYNAGIIIVVAAGNGDAQYNAIPVKDTCPAHYHEKVITVGATNKDMGVTSFSNYGPEIDICAPGQAIYSAYYDQKTKVNGYANMSGTSMSAPFVSGLAGMMKSINDNLTMEEFDLLMSECATKPEGWDYTNNGAGVLDMGLCASLMDDINPTEVKFTVDEVTQENVFVASLTKKVTGEIKMISYITFYNQDDEQIGYKIEPFSSTKTKINFSNYIDNIPEGTVYVRGSIWTMDMKPICTTKKQVIVTN